MILICFILFVFQHFKALAEENKLDNALKGMGGGGGGMEGDQLIL